MAKPAPIIPLDQWLASVKWMSPEEFLAGGAAHRLSPVRRALLTTDGSTTTFLHALCMKPITLEVADQQTVRLPPLLAGWLESGPEASPPEHEALALQRSVWLTDGARRLALGRSLIALHRLEPALHRQLIAETQPIGLLANELGLPSQRDRLQIGSVADADLAKQFGASSAFAAEPLWCRRYRLRIPGALTAAIIEVFPPDLEFEPSA
ncbi:MAG: chorismate pyruvate-lyase family protein [Nitrospirota bacterium]